MASKQLYDRDFYAWTYENANLVREGRFDEIDVEHIVEELEALGRSEKRELSNRLEVLLMHLLKWQFQPGHQSSSWRGTINEQRRRIQKVLKDNPSLKSKLSDVIKESYKDAREAAIDETGLKPRVFPAKCPYEPNTILDKSFWP